MFGLFKQKRQPAELTDAEKIARVTARLKMLGFDITPYGERVALLEVESGYSDVDAASHIALTTMALDIKEAGTNLVRLMSFVPDGMAILQVLKNYKDKGMMHPTQWRNDSTALYQLIKVGQEQEQWINKILSDPIAGKERLATSRLQKV